MAFREGRLLIWSSGRWLVVTALFTSLEAANAYLAEHEDEGVIRVIGHVIARIRD